MDRCKQCNVVNIKDAVFCKCKHKNHANFVVSIYV